MLTFPTAEHEEAYNNQLYSLMSTPGVEHVSGNGVEIIVYKRLDENSVRVNIYEFVRGGRSNHIYMIGAFLFDMNTEQAPFVFASLNPEYFESGVKPEPRIHENTSTPADRAFANYTHAVQNDKHERYEGYVIGNGFIFVTSHNHDMDSLCVTISDFDDSRSYVGSHGVRHQGGFFTDRVRAELIRQSILSYYGTEAVN